jgi:hypothetical protein
MLPKFYI